MTPKSGAMVLRNSGLTGTLRTTHRGSLESSILRKLMSESDSEGESPSCSRPVNEFFP